MLGWGRAPIRSAPRALRQVLPHERTRRASDQFIPFYLGTSAWRCDGVSEVEVAGTSTLGVPLHPGTS